MKLCFIGLMHQKHNKNTCYAIITVSYDKLIDKN
jgi:hypothetical protein